MALAIDTWRKIGGRLALRCGLARAVGRFRRDASGATAVEFSLVAVPFFAFMFSILEMALTFFAQQLLDEAVATASRQIRTGQVQQQALNAANFKSKVCAQLVFMFDCSGVVVDIKMIPTFGSIDMTVPLDPTGNLNKDNPSYTPGKGSNIVVVRAFYQWPIVVNRVGNVGFGLVSMPGSTRLLTATSVFRNEPFPW